MAKKLDPEKQAALQKQQAARLVEARERAGFEKGVHAAKALDIPIASYTQYENGKRSLLKVSQYLADRLGVSQAWLLTGQRDDTLERIAAALEGVNPSQRPLALRAALGAIEGLSEKKVS